MYVLCWVFVIYAYIGWCAEVIYAALVLGEFVNRGFLNGPVCPIYGFGVILITACLAPLQNNIPLLFLGSVLLASALEWVGGFVLEKVFGQRWWDYSDEPFNLGGYICLRFSLIWGVGCLLVVKFIHPAVLVSVGWLPHRLGLVLLGLIAMLLAVDIAATVAGVIEMNRRLSQIEQLAGRLHATSDAIGRTLAGGVLSLTEKSQEVRQSLAERGEKLRTERDELRARLEHLLSSSDPTSRRLLRAFPKMRSSRYRQALEQWKRRFNSARRK